MFRRIQASSEEHLTYDAWDVTGLAPADI